MIFISAGHHDAKPGACFEDFCEHGEAKLWASIIAHHLGSAAIVVPTGVLSDKVQFINQFASNDPVSIAVEIHFNSDPARAGNGCETLHYPDSAPGMILALYIQEALAPLFPPDRGIKVGYYRMDPARGVDFFLRRVRYPAAIIEPEFIHHRGRIQANRDAGCAAIAAALEAAYAAIAADPR